MRKTGRTNARRPHLYGWVVVADGGYRPCSGAYVTFDWSPSTDNVRVVRYSVYRVGRAAPVAVTTYSKVRISTVRGARYYVRAVDSSGNRSWISTRARGR